jgi:flagellin-like protein
MKKAISPVVATALLLVIAVTAVVGFNTWFSTYQTKVLSNVDNSKSNSLASVNIEGIFDDRLYLKGPSSGNLSIQKIKIGSILCNTTNVTALPNTVSSLDLLNCTQNLADGYYDVVIITDTGVINKIIKVKGTIPKLDTSPDTFGFTNQQGVAPSTVIVSNIISAVGFTGSLIVNVSGQGSPQLNVNGGGWTSSASIISGQTLQLRLTSSGTYSSMRNVTLVLGDYTTIWSVSTASCMEFTHTTCYSAYITGCQQNGTYIIDPDGAGGVGSFNVYCDMSTSHGGWTLFANHADLTVVSAVNYVNTTSYGVMQTARWQALRTASTKGMMFIDENKKVSNISMSKLTSANCLAINNSFVNNLADLTYWTRHGTIWHNENTGCVASGLDYSIINLRNNLAGGASIYDYSSVKFELWPYSTSYSDTEQNQLKYFIK